jgi:type VI secretion system protein VasG
LVVVPYYPLADEQIRRIVKLKLAKIQDRFKQNHRADLEIDQKLIDAVTARCTEVESGARNIDQILTQTLLPELSTELLVRMAADQPFSRVAVTLRESGDFAYSIQ